MRAKGLQAVRLRLTLEAIAEGVTVSMPYQDVAVDQAFAGEPVSAEPDRPERRLAPGRRGEELLLTCAQAQPAS